MKKMWKVVFQREIFWKGIKKIYVTIPWSSKEKVEALHSSVEVWVCIREIYCRKCSCIDRRDDLTGFFPSLISTALWS